MHTLHPTTEILIAQLRTTGPQSLLISGPEGIGLLDIAHLISASHETVVVTPDETKVSRPITIEVIRQLYETTRSKSNERQYVIIDEADAMTHGAQGAFLKLLEEPNASIHFVLTSSQPDRLLPTIRSRVQHHNVAPTTREQSEAYLTELGVTNEMMRRQLLYIAEGLPEELSRLVADKDYFEAAAQRMKDVRELLQAPLYDKLLLVNGYRDSRAKALQLVLSAISVTRRSLSERPQKSLVSQLEKLLEASEILQANGNVRLSLAQLVL